MGKTYLGDGAYVEMREDGIVFTTSNGVYDTNTIYLEWPQMNKFQAWWYMEMALQEMLKAIKAARAEIEEN